MLRIMEDDIMEKQQITTTNNAEYFDFNNLKNQIDALYTKYMTNPDSSITMNTPISQVQISNGISSTECRIHTYLSRAGINTVEQLANRFNQGDFHNISGFGKNSFSLKAVDKFIHKHHLESPKAPEDITELFFRVTKKKLDLQADYDAISTIMDVLKVYNEQSTTSKSFDPVNAFLSITTNEDIEDLRNSFNKLALCKQNILPLIDRCSELINMIDSQIDGLKPYIDEIAKRVQRGERIEEQSR